MKVALVLAFVISGLGLLAFPVAVFFTVVGWPLRFSTARDLTAAIGLAGALLYPALWATCLVFARRGLAEKNVEHAFAFSAAPFAWFAIAYWLGIGAISG